VIWIKTELYTKNMEISKIQNALKRLQDNTSIPEAEYTFINIYKLLLQIEKNMNSTQLALQESVQQLNVLEAVLDTEFSYFAK
jgi:hypothetical protein